MPTIYILYFRVLDECGGDAATIGGVQSYLMALAKCLQGNGRKVVIVQRGTVDFEREYQGVTIWGRLVSKNVINRNVLYLLFRRIRLDVDPDNDIIIWGHADYGKRIKSIKTVSIQHGVSFDVIRYGILDKIARKIFLVGLQRYFRHKKAVKALEKTDYLVCVDYNYFNWFRTMECETSLSRMIVIPNFTDICQSSIKRNKQFTEVLFARRFSPERGCKNMIVAAEQLLEKYDDLTFTFAGEGEMLVDIENLRVVYPRRVFITKYCAQDSLEFHMKYDIAVIPSLGSEGTSLSLLEAMASGCITVASHVGGVTNILIDQFNGYLISPTSDAIVFAIDSIRKSPENADIMRENAKLTVERGFNKALWECKWRKVISTQFDNV